MLFCNVKNYVFNGFSTGKTFDEMNADELDDIEDDVDEEEERLFEEYRCELMTVCERLRLLRSLSTVD